MTASTSSRTALLSCVECRGRDRGRRIGHHSGHDRGLKEGDTFVVFVEDFPRAFKAGSIANDGKQLTVTGEKVDINSVLVSIDAQGVVKGDLAQMQPNEGTQITYILSDDTETPDLMAALNGEKPIKSIHLSRTISGVTVTCNVESYRR